MTKHVFRKKERKIHEKTPSKRTAIRIHKRYTHPNNIITHGELYLTPRFAACR
jgi:hypothetical protein